ncbi:MAG: calcium/sodium antiporter [Saprospirales bacterium]|nr:calcium/sodium antiporter [Saprospirales bacterium]
MLFILFLIAGFVSLIFGANILVESASALAKRFNIPNIVIGLTIVAFGTSSPELLINVFAAVEGNSQIAMGNVIGSNIFNVFGILGISALIYPLAVKSNTTWIEIPLSFLAALIVLVLANDLIIDKLGISSITRIDGIILLFFFVIFLVYTILLAKKGEDTGETMQIKKMPLWKSILLIIAGLALLVIGGRSIVYSAVEIARHFQISERIIALTIISIGTSLPELATSAVAAYKKNSDIAIGNIVGSNIFNVFLILGISSVINPVPLMPEANFDLLVHIASAFLLFLIIFTGKKHQMDRWEGGVFLSLYIAYVVALIVGVF